MVIHIDWPIPGHLNLLENGSVLELVTILDPEERVVLPL